MRRLQANKSCRSQRIALNRLTAGISLAVFCALMLVQTASAVPSGVPKDPPAPPTGLGRLFGQEARLTLDNCAVTSQTASNAVVGFSSTYPYRFRRFQRSDSTWTSWTTLPTGATSWDCQSTCFHDTARVEIRGCENSTCATGATSECAIPIGVPNNGPPALDWSGIETTSAGVLGCVQSDHTEIVVRLRYAGTHPLAGYPQIGGQPASERVAGRQDAGSVRNRVYAAPAGWTPADIAGGSWTTTVSLDSSGSRDVSLAVELSESCLSSPQAAIVGSGGTLAPIASGQLFIGGSELEISSGNPSSIYALTSHQLNHDGAVEPFGRITPATGLSDTAHSWLETATGRDGLTYTSPDLDLTAQAIACESDPALVTWWMDNSDDIYLPDSTDWVPGPTVMTNACPGVSPPPEPGGDRSVSDARVGTGSVATGWPTELQASSAIGQITELYYWYGGGWDNSGSDWYFYAKRNLTCAAGERIVSGSCQTCPTYDECVGNSLQAQTYCGDGAPPGDAYQASYQACVGGSTVTLNACVDAGDLEPADAPCSSCPSGQRLVAGSCETCPTYQACSGNSLVTQDWCNAGAPPGDAYQASYQACVGGSTVTLNACVNGGGSAPSDSPCGPTPGTETYCDSNGVARTRPASGTDDEDNLDSASDCTSSEELNSDSCCEALGTESYCDSSGNAQTQLASGFQDVDNLDSSSDCASDEELNSQNCCVEQTGPCEPSGTKPCVEGYTHSWSTSTCSYRRSTSKIPKPACQEPQSEATWSCSDEEWQHGTVTAPACRLIVGLGRVYDRWQSTSCSYGYTTLAPPDDTACGAATFTSSCAWVDATAPPQPDDTACGSATLDSACAWVAATAPPQPDDTACGAATLDSACAWVAATAPPQPDDTPCGAATLNWSCVWVDATAPPQPDDTACGSATLDSACAWVDAPPPPPPGDTACGAPTLNSSCVWVAATAPPQPLDTPCGAATLNWSCVWVDATAPPQPDDTACGSATLDSACAWVAATAPPQPDDTACGAATLNSSCAWVAATAPPQPDDTACGSATLDSACAWVDATAPPQPDDTACGAATLDSACAWVAATAPPQPDDTACGSATLDSACAWVAATAPPQPDDTACGSATLDSACAWVAATAPPQPDDTACGSATLDSACAWVAATAPPQPDDTACGAATLNSSCAWVAATAPADPGGCPAEGQAWDLQGCEYVAVNVPPIACNGTLAWEDCEWECVALDIQFSFPSVISQQTSQATYEQSLDLAFNSDGSITLIEILVGPGITGEDGMTITSLGNWATGADVARASEVVEYRLAGTDWGQCFGSSSWAPFSGLAMMVAGEAHVGQVASSCRFEFRYADGHASAGSSRIQLSTQASSGPGLPGQMN